MFTQFYGRLVTILLFTLLSGFAFANASEMNNAKMEIMMLSDTAHGRPIRVNLWYPEALCKEDTSQRCLAASAHLDRVIVFSHGSMGSADGYRWFMQTLAERGNIVVGISHYQESWVYGQNTIDPSSVLRFWQRPQDVSAMINTLSKRDLFNQAVNWNSIIMAGHSAGGQTATSLAGVTVNADQIADYCRSDMSTEDLGCSYGEKDNGKQSALPEAFFAASAKSYKDPRVQAMILLDPAMGPAAVAETMRAVSIPVLVIGAKHNDFLPFEHHAARYAEHLPNATLVELSGDEGHFVFVDVCNHPHKAQGVAICQDRAGVNRAKVHQKMLGDITSFLDRVDSNEGSATSISNVQ